MANGVPPTLRQMVPRTIRTTVFQGCNISMVRREEGDGWNCVIIDPSDNHTYICPFDEKTKRALVNQMTGISVPEVRHGSQN